MTAAKRLYGMGKTDTNISGLMSAVVRRNPKMQPSARRRKFGPKVTSCKAAIRRLDRPYDHVAELMRDYGLTEGKVRTLIAKVAREKM